MSQIATRSSLKHGNVRSSWNPHLGLTPSLLLVAPLALAILVLVVYPLLMLIWDSFTAGEGGLSNYTAAFGSSAVRRALFFTVLDSLIVAIITVAMAALITWKIKTTSSTIVRTLLLMAIFIPFIMGVVVKNYAFVLLLAREGLLNSVLLTLGVVAEPLQLLYTHGAVVSGMVYTMIPYAALAILPSISAVDTDLLNAGRSMGSTERRVFRTVLLPILRPALITTGAMVFAISVGFYVTPVVLGGSQVPFIATLISQDIFTFYNYPRASATSVILLLIAGAVVAVTLRVVGPSAIRGLR